MTENALFASPERIMATLSGFQETAILKGAIELGVFTEIAGGFDAAPALAAQCKADPHGIETLCNSLTVMGFLEKSGDRYRLTPDSALFLNRNSPAYLGDMTRFLLAPEMVGGWSDIAATVRRGGPDGLANVAPEHPIWIEFAKGMGPFVTMTARMLAGIVVAGGAPRQILDVAAGHGLFGIEIARAEPDARVIALDWPKVLEVARDNAAAAGVADRWTALPGSAFDVPFGTGYDLVLLTNFLHHFDRATCEDLLRKAHAALAPGGRVATLEFVPNEDGVSPAFAARFGMVMLTSTPKGRAYRYSELKAMHEAAGLSSCELVDLAPTPQRLVIARRS